MVSSYVATSSYDVAIGYFATKSFHLENVKLYKNSHLLLLDVKMKILYCLIYAIPT